MNGIVFFSVVWVRAVQESLCRTVDCTRICILQRACQLIPSVTLCRGDVKEWQWILCFPSEGHCSNALRLCNCYTGQCINIKHIYKEKWNGAVSSLKTESTKQWPLNRNDRLFCLPWSSAVIFDTNNTEMHLNIPRQEWWKPDPHREILTPLHSHFFSPLRSPTALFSLAGIPDKRDGRVDNEG